jgi:hypothetical protein
MCRRVNATNVHDRNGLFSREAKVTGGNDPCRLVRQVKEPRVQPSNSLTCRASRQGSGIRKTGAV